MKKVLQWGLIGLLLFYLITQPSAAAGVIHSIVHGLGAAASGLSRFVTSLAA